MKNALFVLMVWTQVGCVSAFKLGNAKEMLEDSRYTRHDNGLLYKQMNAEREKNQKKWDEMNKKYVSDDVIIVEIVDFGISNRPPLAPRGSQNRPRN